MNALANPFAEPKIQTDQNNSEPELQRYQQWQLLSSFLFIWLSGLLSWGQRQLTETHWLWWYDDADRMDNGTIWWRWLLLDGAAWPVGALGYLLMALPLTPSSPLPFPTAFVLVECGGKLVYQLAPSIFACPSFVLGRLGRA